jgi:AcrR family transcriptional regulator
VSSEETADKILRAFLSLAAERGMSAITTRDIAAAAAVNEVTVFRHFGGKATLAREAVRRFSPAAELNAYQPRIDTSSPQARGRGTSEQRLALRMILVNAGVAI